MTFIQIIRFTTTQPDAVDALGKEMEASAGPPKFSSLIRTKDRDRTDTYLSIVEFESYEAAMANSNAPETQEFAAKMMALASGPPEFWNLDVLEKM